MDERKKLTPQGIHYEYQKGVDFNTAINLYSTVETNENFFIGKQWEGVQANGLPTPVFNFLKRVVLFNVASISTDNLKLHASPLPCTSEYSTALLDMVTAVINSQFDAIFEDNKIGSLLRVFCRDAAVDGDGCTYTYWDENAETGQYAKGAIRTEVLPNTRVIFGNPNCREVQRQPYIIIKRRMELEEAKDRAKANGCSKADIDQILPDEGEADTVGKFDQYAGGKVTVLVRLWRDKKSGTIRAKEVTSTVTIRPEWDLGVKLYPITWLNWDYIQDCYHGQAMITGLIPNQVYVNKLFAMSMISLMTLAYPKIIYDKTRIAKWDNRVGAAIAVNGGDMSNVARIMDPAQVSPQISQFIELAISYTQKFLGASDVALGDTRPDNTSAIIALQRAAATPMEITKQNLLQSIEDLGEIYLEFMGEYYGARYAETKSNVTGMATTVLFDYSLLKIIPMSLKLDVGASSYWSEIANMQTLDNLLMQGKIDTVSYLERVPAGMITDKERLIDTLRGTMGMPGGAQQNEETMLDAGMPPPIPMGRGNATLQRKINQTGEIPVI